MALTIEAVQDPSVFGVRLTVAGHVGAFTIDAQPSGRTSYTVRPIGSTYPDPSVMIDYAVPFAVPVRYTVVDSVGNVASASIEDAGVSGCVLSSTVSPSIARVVRVVEDRPHEWETRSAWFDVIGRRDPLVTTDVLRYRAGTLALYVSGNGARAGILSLLDRGDPLLLRTSVPTRVDDVIMLPLRISEEPLVDETGGRVFRIDYQAVTRPLGPFPGTSDWTYAILDATYTDYAEVLATYTDYASLYLGPIPAPALGGPSLWSVHL